jgi:hypothetical protein
MSDVDNERNEQAELVAEALELEIPEAELAPAAEATPAPEPEKRETKPITETEFRAMAALSQSALKTMTPKQWKEAMRAWFTVRRARVEPCGHKYDPDRDPRHNCENCWFAYFNNHKEMVEIANECFTQHGKSGLSVIRGERFTKNFVQFMATVARLMMTQQAMDKAQQEKVNVEEGSKTIGGLPEDGSLPTDGIPVSADIQECERALGSVETGRDGTE